MTEETQDKIGTGVGAIAGTGAGVLSSGAIISTVGVTTGVSGAGIMSGLATVGSVVGGGALAGVFVLAVGTVGLAAAGAYGGYRITKWLHKKPEKGTVD